MFLRFIINRLLFHQINLDVIKIDQPVTKFLRRKTQQIKFTKELSRCSKTQTIYIFDTPTIVAIFRKYSKTAREIRQKLIN